MLKIWDADVLDGKCDGALGEITEITKSQIIVNTGNGRLAINELQLEGKKRMTTDAFLRGMKLEKGTVLGK